MAHKKLLLKLACASSIVMLPNVAQAATYTLDFDTDANGNAINVGDLGISVGNWEDAGNPDDYIVSDQWLSDFGVSISGYQKPGYNPVTGQYNADLSQLQARDLVLFSTDPNTYSENSSARKGNGEFHSGGTFDRDLLSGHDDLTEKTYLVAKDDATNTPWDLGNVLILQETQNKDKGDYYHKPDDEANGGVISFSFDEIIDLASIDLLDVSDDFGTRGKQIIFTSYDENDQLLETWKFDQDALDNGTAERLSKATDDNSLYRFNFNKEGVKRLDLLYPGSGAIAALNWDKAWEEEQESQSVPEPATVLALLGVAGLSVRLKQAKGKSTVAK